MTETKTGTRQVLFLEDLHVRNTLSGEKDSHYPDSAMWRKKKKKAKEIIKNNRHKRAK
jgi:hypothetical protein